MAGPSRRMGTVAALAGALALAADSSEASAQAYPERPVRIVNPFPAGGHADMLLRVTISALSRRWEQTIVVEHRAGGSTAAAVRLAAEGAPDGYRLLVAGEQAMIVEPLAAAVPTDVGKAFVPVALIARLPADPKQADPAARSWVGLFAPAGTPRAIIDKVQADVAQVLKTETAEALLSARGFDLVSGTADALYETIERDTARWRKALGKTAD